MLLTLYFENQALKKAANPEVCEALLRDYRSCMENPPETVRDNRQTSGEELKAVEKLRETIFEVRKCIQQQNRLFGEAEEKMNAFLKSAYGKERLLLDRLEDARGASSKLRKLGENLKNCCENATTVKLIAEFVAKNAEKVQECVDECVNCINHNYATLVCN